MTDGITLVTGGTGALGRAVVSTLTGERRRVVFTWHNDGTTAERIVALHDGAAIARRLDLRNADGIEKTVADIESELGPIEALVNNAGVASRGLLAMTSDSEWARVVDTDLGGVFRICRAVLPGMLRRRAGAIVNVSSLAALHGVAGQATYAAAKAGVVGMTRALAREVGGRGIRVNAVAPGLFLSEMTAGLSERELAALRAGECLPDGVRAEDVAAVVAFLLSTRAAAMTGQCLAVDAGASA